MYNGTTMERSCLQVSACQTNRLSSGGYILAFVQVSYAKNCVFNVCDVAGSRITTTFRFGFIALDMLSIVPEDAGEYACVVVSATGNAQSVAKLTVTGKKLIENSSIHFGAKAMINFLLLLILSCRTSKHRSEKPVSGQSSVHHTTGGLLKISEIGERRRTVTC